MNDITRAVLLVALACNAGGVGATEPRTNNGPMASPSAGRNEGVPRLDAVVTPANSVLFDFGYGEVVRLPKILIPPSVIPNDPKEPIRAKAVSMTFWYPDMTPTGWVPLIDIIFEKKRGVYVSQKDRFRVLILRMFYSPGDLRNLRPGQGKLMEPGPEQIERNRDRFNDKPMHRVKTPFPGLEAKVSDYWMSHHPGQGTWDPKKGGRYVAKPQAPYELSMDCDVPEEGVECVAHVYSKKHRFQYRMMFAPEAVRHTDELIRAIDKMIGQWPVEAEQQH